MFTEAQGGMLSNNSFILLYRKWNKTPRDSFERWEHLHINKNKEELKYTLPPAI
jgi:hypothetical protein